MKKGKNNLFIKIAIIFLGVFFITCDHFNTTHENENEINVLPTEEAKPIMEFKQAIKRVAVYDYIAVLEIPSINLNKGLVNINSEFNDVGYNPQILKGSSMPDVKEGNLVIAGHNGNGQSSFFRRLDKMKKGDEINVYYQGNKYEYKLMYSYEIEKTGNVEVIRDSTMTVITLITCKKNTKDKQIVYIGYLTQ